MTVPYSDSFAWEMGTQYFGASLGAMIRLARAQGIPLRRHQRLRRSNAFFVREDLGREALADRGSGGRLWHPVPPAAERGSRRSGTGQWVRV